MQTFKIDSPYNNEIKLKVSQGHFATTSSHINYYIDLATIKARANEAYAVAKSMASEYMATSIVDTIVCMDGTEVIGAYLAEELTASGIMSMNQHNTIYVIRPETNSVGQLTFKDNLIPMISGKHILLLLATATTGRTVEKALECIQYYGGEISGISSIFSAAYAVENHDVHAIFHAEDIEGYTSYSSHDCPYCKSGVPLDGLITDGGFTEMKYNK